MRGVMAALVVRVVMRVLADVASSFLSLLFLCYRSIKCAKVSPPILTHVQKKVQRDGLTHRQRLRHTDRTGGQSARMRNEMKERNRKRKREEKRSGKEKKGEIKRIEREKKARGRDREGERGRRE